MIVFFNDTRAKYCSFAPGERGGGLKTLQILMVPIHQVAAWEHARRELSSAIFGVQDEEQRLIASSPT